jgi:ATP-dependent DNA helicase DinG
MSKSSIQVDIKKAFKNIKNNMAGFVVRFAQNKMIAQIYHGLTDAKKYITCIEAPTGTGKTLSYLISGILIAKASNKKLIISTATIALQEQLVYKDIPDIMRYSELDFSFDLIKGRNRYVCIRNLNYFFQENNQQPLNDNILNKQQKKQLSKLKCEYGKSWDGELDSLKNPLESSLWQKISCHHQSCNNKRCAFYNQCCFFKKREYIFSSDVLVTNHDLALIDLIAGNTALPSPNEAYYIFDEAHPSAP